MKTKTELQQDIINITTTIHREFPELSKYIVEMPVTGSEKEGINKKIVTYGFTKSRFYNLHVTRGI